MKILNMTLATKLPGFHKWRNHCNNFFVPHDSRLKSKATDKKLLAINTQKSFDSSLLPGLLHKRRIGYGN